VAGGRGKDLKTGVPITRIGGVTKCVEIESRAGSGPDRGIVTGLKNRDEAEEQATLYDEL